MNFADLQFWMLLIGALGSVLLIRIPLASLTAFKIESYDQASLGIVGLFLLGCVSIQTLVIFLAVSVVTFGGLHLILRFSHNTGSHRKWLIPLIFLQITPLLYYKYGSFVGQEIFNRELSSLAQIAIPVGISFYTFQLIAFAVDTLVHERPLPSLVNSLNFAGFFPQIVAGPIERRDALLPQLENFRYRWDRVAFEKGLSWIILGLFFKRCMADNLGAYAHVYFGENVYRIWLDAAFFGLQIYFDFCGYSLMALGVACCLGVRLTLNFESPYCARNVGEFWRRWHVTLSTWFRDYLYLPLGGGRTAFWMTNVMIVFVVSGIWHGAGWNFMIWGALHGLFLVVYRLSREMKFPAVLAYALTHLCVLFAWVPFYESNSAELFRRIGVMLSPSSYLGSALMEGMQIFPTATRISMVGMLILAVGVLIVELLSLRWFQKPYAAFQNRVVVLLMVFAIVFLSPIGGNEFIYFAF